MIRVKIEQTQGPVSRTVSVVASSIERALELVGADDSRAGARVVFPIDAERFFAPTETSAEGIDYGAMTPEEIEDAREAGLPGAREAWLEVLRDDLGEEGFEIYAHENALI